MIDNNENEKLPYSLSQLPSEEETPAAPPVPAEPVAMAMVVPPPGYTETAVMEQEGGQS